MDVRTSAFSVAGPMVWNLLHDHLRDLSLSIGSFRSALKRSFSQCTGTCSAVEALCVTRYTSRQSSSSSHAPWQVQWSGTCCTIISVIYRSASDLFDQHWRHSFSQCTGTRSAVEALCVMRYTSRQSSSSLHAWSQHPATTAQEPAQKVR